MDRIEPTHLTSATVESDLGRGDAADDERAGSVEALDIVFIENFVAQTVIGIDASELHEPQPLRIDLSIGVPSLRACVTDRIDDTVNYAAVREALHALLASHGVQLLEALAEKIAQCLIRDFGAHWVRVSIAKPGKFADVRGVGVLIERRRSGHRHAGRTALTWASLGAGFVPDLPN